MTIKKKKIHVIAKSNNMVDSDPEELFKPCESEEIENIEYQEEEMKDFPIDPDPDIDNPEKDSIGYPRPTEELNSTLYLNKDNDTGCYIEDMSVSILNDIDTIKEICSTHSEILETQAKNMDLFNDQITLMKNTIDIELKKVLIDIETKLANNKKSIKLLKFTNFITLVACVYLFIKLIF